MTKQVEEHFGLKDAGARAKERSQTLTTAEKLHNWTHLTQQLIKTIFGEIYAVRIVNLISKVQFA